MARVSELWPGAPELIMSYKPLTYLVERRNSTVNLPYIPYKPSYPIFHGTQLGLGRHDQVKRSNGKIIKIKLDLYRFLAVYYSIRNER